MQPLTRFVPRLFFDSISSSPANQCLRLSRRHSSRQSICQQCSFHAQARLFADSPKPPPPPNASNPQDRPNSSPSSTSPSPSLPLTSEDAPSSDLPSAEQGRRLAVTKRFSNIMDHLQGNIFIASQRINDLTGYSGIEALKSRISGLESRVNAAQESVRVARTLYKNSVSDRAATQREVTTLLARKDSWSPSDLERFTALYRMDHTNEQVVQDAAAKLAESEREAEIAAGKLSSSILSRYHEEQIWSDKIRRMSTWGTWGLMGVNVLLFLVFQFGFEPWRRRRLVHGFEEKVREALELEKNSRLNGMASKDVPLDGVIEAGLQELEVEIAGEEGSQGPGVQAVVACIKGQQEEGEEEASLDAAEMHVPTALMKLRNQNNWMAAAGDLFSDRIVEMRKQDITMIALEGVATGAAIVTIIATLILRHS